MSYDQTTADLLSENKELRQQRDELRNALIGMTERYTSLVESGDAGNWDCEKEPEVIAARQAIERCKP